MPAPSTHSIPNRVLLLSLGSVLCLVLASVLSLSLGDFKLSTTDIFQALGQSSNSIHGFVIWELRLPRFMTGLLAGAALGMAGAIVQAITRNPLGSPSLMGVSSGAAFAIVLSFVLFDFSTTSHLLFGTAGGILAATLTFAMAWKTHLSPIHLTLAGMSVSLFFASGIVLLLVSANTDAKGIYYWLAGSLANRTWQHVSLLYPFVLAGLALGISFSRPLNLLMLDEQGGRSLGLATSWWRLTLGFIAVLLTSATVAVAGPIAFVGLVSPHMVRFILADAKANEHKLLLPLSALIGAALVCTTDLLAKFQEVPVGVLCILVGSPLFILLIRKQSI